MMCCITKKPKSNKKTTNETKSNSRITWSYAFGVLVTFVICCVTGNDKTALTAGLVYLLNMHLLISKNQ
jgi:hypothetical protein